MKRLLLIAATVALAAGPAFAQSAQDQLARDKASAAEAHERLRRIYTFKGFESHGDSDARVARYVDQLEQQKKPH